MFTGCIKHTGILHSKGISSGQGKLRIVSELAEKVALGDSIAVNGVCLTVENIERPKNYLDFHTLDTTLQKTNLGLLNIGSGVNLEQPLCLGDRLDGHLVTGHVDCVASVLNVSHVKNDFVIEIQLSEEFKPLVVEHGSITVDGISLTIATLNKESFTVHIIPYTFEHTNLREVKVSKLVNLEFDIIGKYVTRSRSLGTWKKSDIC